MGRRHVAWAGRWSGPNYQRHLAGAGRANRGWPAGGCGRNGSALWPVAGVAAGARRSAGDRVLRRPRGHVKCSVCRRARFVLHTVLLKSIITVTKALFSSKIFYKMDTVAFSFVFDKYCPIMD